MAPAVVLGRSDGVLSIETPFHYATIFDSTAYFVDTGDVGSHILTNPICLPGDVLLMVIAVDTSPTTPSLPSESPTEDGWVMRVGPVTSSPNTAITYAIATKVATEADSGANVTITIPETEEVCVQTLCLIGAKPFADWVFGSTKGYSGDTWNFSDEQVAIPFVDHWLGIAVQVQDDNRSPTPSAPSGWTLHLRALTPGSSVAGQSNGVWILESIVGLGDSLGPDTDMVISSNESQETQMIAIPPTAGALFEEQRAMVIQNAGAEDGTNFWTDTVGGLANRGGGPDPFEGSSYFFGGANPQTNAYQDIPIPSDLHTASDEGRLRTVIDWQANSFAGSDDCRINLSWVDGESPENVLGLKLLGNYVSPNQQWVAQQVRHCAPVGSRALRIEIDMLRGAGSNNDGYVDAITGTWKVKPSGS